MVVSSVALPSPPITRLPSLTSLRLMRPAISARTCVKERSSCARASVAAATAYRCFRGLLIGLALIEYVGRDRLRGDERLRALEILSGEHELRLRLRKLTLGLLDGGFIGAGIDHEEQIALLDVVAIAEGYALDIAVDAGTNLDGVHSFETPGKIVPADDFGDHVAC